MKNYKLNAEYTLLGMGIFCFIMLILIGGYYTITSIEVSTPQIPEISINKIQVINGLMIFFGVVVTILGFITFLLLFNTIGEIISRYLEKKGKLLREKWN